MAKHFVVFGSDIFLYDPETDDKLIAEKQCFYCETIKEAKQKALDFLKEEYDNNYSRIKSLTAGQF